MAIVKPLEADALYRACDPAQFDFETTAELEALNEVIGQERAVAAVRFGVGMRQEGYNIFALGPNGTGKYTAVSQYLTVRAAAEPVPPDWSYVYNFEKPHAPRALQLPPGRGVGLREGMKQLVEELRVAIPAAFESEEYHARKEAAEEEFKEQEDRAFEELRRRAEARDIALMRTPAGLAFAPMRQGNVITPEAFQQLPEAQRQRVEQDVAELQDELQTVLYQLPQWQRAAHTKVKELNREILGFAIAPLIAELRQKYGDLPDVVAYLERVEKDIIENGEQFLSGEEAPGGSPEGDGAAASPADFRFGRYQVNALVDHSQAQGAPVIYEDNPTYQNLIGRVEHVAHMGTLRTDFTLIMPGALHRANGGYLILEARKVLAQPYAWEGLKRALRAHQIHIESLGQIYSTISTITLEPEPIPLNVKVVLLGERLLYYQLYENEPDFGELFKVMADFEDEMDRTQDNNIAYARLVATIAHKNNLRPFDRAAVARVIEHSARLVGDAEKLSTQMQSVADLLREADYWAAEASRGVVQAADVQQAIDGQHYRAGRLRQEMREEILRDVVLIDTAGEKVGQINGLSVLSVGDTAFGRPSRITARVWVGKGEVVDIERQVEMGGPIHSKGVLILTGFLGARYATDQPLSLSASLVFEQSYAGVDGDSASSAELYALLSALADAPIQQSLAVTGSVNQHGQVQAIGGVNEKIEGFFDVCQARGLTGDQGVLIPAANAKHLMLRHDVVAAATNEQFHIYAIETIDQGIEVLTGIPAGGPDKQGEYPEDSINGRVKARLAEMSEKQQEQEESKEE